MLEANDPMVAFLQSVIDQPEYQAAFCATLEEFTGIDMSEICNEYRAETGHGPFVVTRTPASPTEMTLIEIFVPDDPEAICRDMAAMTAKWHLDHRCAVCGWPLRATAEDGCVRGNCSQRPWPATLFDPERAELERTPS